jgi:arabinofuranan 3-O-arabinosyltransferase
LEPHARSATPVTRPSTARVGVLAGLLVTWSVAWSAPLHTLSWDTKYDLVLDPWGLLRRALHLWDPQNTWGGPSNQGYGYLFPMGPFFAVGSGVAPAWLVQRAWWTALLTLGFIGALGLLRALDVGSRTSRVVGALAWVLAPKVVSSIGVLSSEVQPQLLCPLILWPIVLGWQGRLSARRASTLSGLAVLACGGVNATATVVALLPTALFLVTRTGWWRDRLTFGWIVAVLAATSWWLVPLILMGRYAPPFLSWIETAKIVAGPITLLDVFRGTTNWVGHLLTPGGPWWPAGFELATSPLLIVLTAVVAALGLGGMALTSMPLRGFWWVLLAIGVLAMSLPHPGPLDSPLVTGAQGLLDGPLAPFRNIHKADLLVRLPFMIGLTHLVSVVASWRRPSGAIWSRVRRRAVPSAAVLVVVAAAPGFTGAIVARGGHVEVPRAWVEVGAWLDEQDDGGAVLVPAASFGEYTWGRTIDEPLRGTTKIRYAVRDAVPLAPAGAIRLLDELERRLQTGRSIAGAEEVLRRGGVRYVVLRNDLATTASGQPPVPLARSALRATPGMTLARGFGVPFVDASGVRVHPVEVYRLQGLVAGDFTLFEGSDLAVATGSSDDLPLLADAGLGSRAVLFDDSAGVQAAARAGLGGVPTILTDGIRARDRAFGAPRGEDASATLAEGGVPGSRDYRPVQDGPLSTMQYSGIAGVSASSSLADDYTFAGYAPAARPFAALDGDPASAWLTQWTDKPTLTIHLETERTVDHVVVTPATPSDLVPDQRAAATLIEVRTASGAVVAALGAGPNRIDLGGARTATLAITILRTSKGDPANALTGLAEVAMPGVVAREVLALPPAATTSPPTVVVLGSGLIGRDGCLVVTEELHCFGGESVDPEVGGVATYRMTTQTPSDWLLSGTLRAGREGGVLGVTPGAVVSASSSRTSAVAAAPEVVLDGDVRTAWSPAVEDASPTVTIELKESVTLTGLRLRTRAGWLAKGSPVVRVEGRRAFDDPKARRRWHDHPGHSDHTTYRADLPLPPQWLTLLSGCPRARGSLHARRRVAPSSRVGFSRVWIGSHRHDQREISPHAGHRNQRGAAFAGAGPLAGLFPRVTLRTFGCRLGVSVARLPARPNAPGQGCHGVCSGSPHRGRWPVDERDGGTVLVTAAAHARVLALTLNVSEGWSASIEGHRLAPIVVDGIARGSSSRRGSGGLSRSGSRRRRHTAGRSFWAGWPRALSWSQRSGGRGGGPPAGPRVSMPPGRLDATGRADQWWARPRSCCRGFSLAQRA